MWWLCTSFSFDSTGDISGVGRDLIESVKVLLVCGIFPKSLCNSAPMDASLATICDKLHSSLVYITWVELCWFIAIPVEVVLLSVQRNESNILLFRIRDSPILLLNGLPCGDDSGVCTPQYSRDGELIDELSGPSILCIDPAWGPYIAIRVILSCIGIVSLCPWALPPLQLLFPCFRLRGLYL